MNPPFVWNLFELDEAFVYVLDSPGSEDSTTLTRLQYYLISHLINTVFSGRFGQSFAFVQGGLNRGKGILLMSHHSCQWKVEAILVWSWPVWSLYSFSWWCCTASLAPSRLASPSSDRTTSCWAGHCTNWTWTGLKTPNCSLGMCLEWLSISMLVLCMWPREVNPDY